MNKEELLKAINDCSLDIAERTNVLAVEIREGKISREDANKQLEELRSKKAGLEKQLAELGKPASAGGEARSLFNKEEFLKAANEKRSITIGDAGSINQIKQLFKKVAETDDVLNAATFYYGPNAATNIPVLTPVADPTGQAEGATGISADSTAGVSVTEITPKAYVSILPISAEMLTMGSVNLEAELPDMFAKAFRRTMHNGMMQGVGTSKAMKGIFVSAAANTAGVTELATSQTAIKLSDIAALALKVASKDETYEIVMNPAVYSAMIADQTAGEDVKIYKESLIRDKMIEGVKVRLDAQAPTATAAGSILAAAVPLSRYAIGVAGQLVIDPIKVKGDTNTYFQATMFFSGKQVSDSDIYSIAVKA